jgi:hypothetical protein
MISPEKKGKPASLRSLAGEYLSTTRADDSKSNNIVDQDSASCKAELSEGLTEFLLKKIIQLRARLQPEFALSEQGEAQAPRLPVGPAMGIA